MADGTEVRECSKPDHGPMTLRPAGQQTREQQFCGKWYDCAHPSCRDSVLAAGAELLAQLSEQQPAAPAGKRRRRRG